MDRIYAVAASTRSATQCHTLLAHRRPATAVLTRKRRGRRRPRALLGQPRAIEKDLQQAYKDLAADPAAVESNMIVVNVTDEKTDADQVAARLAGQGVLVNSLDARRIRIVTNYHVTSSDVEQVIDAFAAVLRGDALEAAPGYISG